MKYSNAVINKNVERKEKSSMKGNNFRNKRLKSLVKGKIKNVGIFERTKLKIAGYIDGSRGLPRLDDRKVWTSAFLDNEAKGYEEFCSYIWAMLQIESEKEYAHLERSAKDITQIKVSLDEARERLMNVKQNETISEPNRKEGEDKLADSQVKLRRSREKEKRVAPFKNKVNELEIKLKNLIGELNDISSRLLEDNNTTSMVCNRVKDHTLQRINVYWNAVLKKHPASESMPATPRIELMSYAEHRYIELHKGILNQIESIQNSLV